MPPKAKVGPLNEDQVNARMNKLEGIITDDAQKEIKQMMAEATEDVDEMKRSLLVEPRQVIDEWVEKLRAFTERQTKIHYARLRRIAKLRILEAYGDIRESIKNEARELIKQKMSKKSEESDRIFREMLFQGLLRLMETKVLVHTTKADLERISKHYEWATKQYKNTTGMDLKLITSRHPLKDNYFGRIVISDKESSMFVDMNLVTSVDTVADEVFTHYAAYQDKAGTYKNWGMEALKQKGLQIMPRGPNITLNQLDSILSAMRGDPRTQTPVFQIKEEEKKQAIGDGGEDAEHNFGSSKLRTSNNQAKSKKVTIAQEPMGMGMRPSLSLMDPGSYAPSKYSNYMRRSQENSDHALGPSNDLYNLEYSSNTELVSQPSKATMNMQGHDEPSPKKSTISADKEAPKASGGLQENENRGSVAESTDSRFSERSSQQDQSSPQLQSSRSSPSSSRDKT